MNSHFDSLRPEVTRFLSLWEREIITETETSCGLVDRIAFSLLERPDAEDVLRDILHMVPLPLLNEMERQLEVSQTPEGKWKWPPGGPGLADPVGDRTWGNAQHAQATAIECLLDCLRHQRTKRISEFEQR